jgi:Periplasmic binding protein-like domain
MIWEHSFDLTSFRWTDDFWAGEHRRPFRHRSGRLQLTTVRQPVEDMAAEMARLLLTLIDHPGHAPTSVIFEPELVIWQSA